MNRASSYPSPRRLMHHAGSGPVEWWRMSTTGSAQEWTGHLLLVEDDPDVANALEAIAASEGHRTEIASTLAEARAFLDEKVPDLVLLDLTLPDGNGLDLLDEIREIDEVISVIILTAQTDVATVVRGMQHGADNFLPKPIERSLLVKTISRVLREHRNRQHVETYRNVISSRQTSPETSLPKVIGSSQAMDRIREQIIRVAQTDTSVILRGESGTGKGMLAREIHRLSARASGPFVDVNCASIQPQLVESEIFGHEKGAFTGATARKPGLLEVANGGTLFLDEVADLDQQAQAKLLKALEDRTFRRVGGVRILSVDIRLVAATHRDLDAMVASGDFRQDLFYRLNVFPIWIPPLRERPDDLAELVGHFLRTVNPLVGSQVTGVSGRAEELLLQYHWPGNVRELRNVIERAIILARTGKIEVRHLPKNLAPRARRQTLRPLEDVEREHISGVLKATSYNIKRSASILGLSRSTLYAKIKKYGIPVAPRNGS